MKNGQCPQCGGREVHVMNGPYADLVSIPLSTWAAAATDYYVCTTCGYVALYVRHAVDLPKIAAKWPRVLPQGGDGSSG